MQLYIGIIVMDLGLLILGSFNGSSLLIMFYLLGFRLVTGAIDVARAIEARKNKAPWKIRLTAGIISLGTALGFIFFKDPYAVVDIYCIGLLFSAVEHIITAINGRVLGNRLQDFDISWLWDFEFTRLGLPHPDAVVALSMRPEVSRALIEKRCVETGVKKDIHEADSDYLERCYDALHYVSDVQGWHLLECAENGVPYTIPVMQEKICRVLGV